MPKRWTIHVGNLGVARCSRALELVDRIKPKLESSTVRIGDLQPLGVARSLQPFGRVERLLHSLPEFAIATVTSVLLACVAVPIIRHANNFGQAASPQSQEQPPRAFEIDKPRVVAPIAAEQNVVVPPKVTEPPVGPSIGQQVLLPADDAGSSGLPSVITPNAATPLPTQDARVDGDRASRHAYPLIKPLMTETLSGLSTLR